MDNQGQNNIKLGAFVLAGFLVLVLFLSKVGKQHSKPQPQSNLQVEAQCAVMRHQITQQIDARYDAANLNHKHDRILHHCSRAQLHQRINQCAAYDLGVPKGTSASVCHICLSSSELEALTSVHQ